MSKPIEEYTWRELTPGCVMTEPGSAREYKTGDWRSQHPVWDRERCIRCGVCWIFCPDAAIFETSEGYFDMLPDYCKGCGICGRECVTGCISYVAEGS